MDPANNKILATDNKLIAHTELVLVFQDHRMLDIEFHIPILWP